MRLIKPPKSLGYIPGPRPRLPDEERGMLRTLAWVLAIAIAVAIVLLFRKQNGT